MASCGEIPGSSLNGRNPNTLKVPELKRWLECRGASTRGNKKDLVARVHAYIKNGWDDNIVNPDELQSADTQDNSSTPSNETSAPTVWTDIKKSYKTQSEVPLFSHGQMVTYFVTRTVSDGLPAGDFNAMNKKAKGLYDCGHIQNIEVGSTPEHVWVRCNCLPEMKKNTVYKTVLSLAKKSFDIEFAKCGCKAGRGPKASCKHIGALCYAFAEFCKSGHLTNFLSSTEMLQQWNGPRTQKVDIVPVDKLCARRESILTKCESINHSTYDPRPCSLRTIDCEELVENLRDDMLKFNPSCGLLQLLIPPVATALHDHDYIRHSLSESGTDDTEFSCSLVLRGNDEILLEPNDISAIPLDEKKKLNVTPEERNRIEEVTRTQSYATEWHAVRSRRITGSKCGKILCQQTKTDALLISVLDAKYTLDHTRLPASLKWGIDNETEASRRYVAYMREKGHTNLSIRKCGFIIHPIKGWLGASPDALVNDLSPVKATSGILEIKFPITKKDVTPLEACKDPHFYCTIHDNQLKLRRNHPYYHQVQLELYVTQDMKTQWCDFCVYTLKGVAVERIMFDQEWCKENIEKLESYFDEYMLPEITFPKLKPSYVL